MPFAIELFLDEPAEQAVRRIWAALDEHNVTSLASIPNTDYHPHVSLTVFDRGDAERLPELLRPVLAQSLGLPLPLAALGLFLTEEAPAFLGVIPSSRFLDLHRRLHQTLQPLVEGVWPHYRPDALFPHCTLAMGATDRASVVQVVSRFRLPINAQAASANLVELPSGHVRTRLA